MVWDVFLVDQIENVMLSMLKVKQRRTNGGWGLEVVSWNRRSCHELPRLLIAHMTVDAYSRA